MATIKEAAPSPLTQSLDLPDRTTLAAFLFFILVSGGASVAIRFTYAELPPFFSGAACFAETNVIAKIFPRNHPVATNAVAMPVGALILGVASFISGETFVIPRLAITWIAFSYIVIFVTIIAFLLYLFILSRWTASGTSYSFVLIPLVTIILASWLANEQTTLQFLLGGTLVVLGVWIGALWTPKKS